MSKDKTNLNTTKEQERSELHRAIWQIANDLRGSIDGWDFKQYVLGILFYRFISENLTNYINTDERRSGKKDFDYATLSDKEAEFGRTDTVKEKGFYILPSELFVNVRKNARNDANLNETLSSVFNNIENSAKGSDSEDDLKGLFDDLDVNSNKLGSNVEKRNQKLVKLLEAIGDLKLGDYGDNTIDAFGDAYEFLMTMYASNAGKSGGEFFTPQEVSELLAEITTVGKKEVNKVYDPCCGSGSLLLKFAKVLGKENVRQGFYGQEINLTTYNLCRINMFLHDINYNNFDIAHGDTLTDPKHWDDEPFDAIVSNPPYSIKWDGDANPIMINDPRFSPAGVLAPKSKADLAFTMHMLSWLSTSGTAAIVEFPGVLYRGSLTGRGDKSEVKIRKYLVDNNYVDAIIQLPSDLFFGPTISTCILVLKKSKKDNNILFIDASNEFIRPGNKNKLSDENRKKILDAYSNRKNVEYFAKLVSNKEISDNEYNLSVSTYLGKESTAKLININEINEKINSILVKQKKYRDSINQLIELVEGGKFFKGNDDLSKIEYKRIDEICKVITGGDKPKGCVKGQTEPTEEYPYPVYSNGVETYGYANTFKVDKEAVTISSIGNVGFVAYREAKFTPIIRLKVLIPKEENILTKFVYYYLQTLNFIGTNSSLSSMKAADLQKYKVPILPVDVQKKIIEMLDTYNELENELENRKSQFKYYREKLLNFEGANNESD